MHECDANFQIKIFLSFRFLNVLMPGAISESRYAKRPTLHFKQMELIGLFIEKIKDFGIPDHENFATVDLFEEQNLYQVLLCLQSIGRRVSYLFLVYLAMFMMLICQKNANLM